MTNMTGYWATIVVHLPQPTTGADVVEAIKAVVQSHKDAGDPVKLVEYHRFDHDDDTYEIGQTSYYPWFHFRVFGQVPVQKKLRGKETYTELVIKSYEWPEADHEVGCDPEYIIREGRRFADNLLAQVSGVLQS